jgi:hypothetical protein
VVVACKTSATGHNTPCLAPPETIGGSATHDSLCAQDTVYFTGNDPAMGRRQEAGPLPYVERNSSVQVDPSQ